MIERMCLSESEKTETRRIIKERTGYFIRSTSILNQVFRRSSFAAETGESSNEIFEFIGDQILGFYVVKIISEKCGGLSLMDGYAFRIRENRFAQIKQELVNNDLLAQIIEEWDVAKYLLLSRSDINNHVVQETKVKADLFEAILGAIAIESNWNPEVLETAVSMALNIESRMIGMIENDPAVRQFDIENAVTVLKELAESGQCTMPKYVFEGPNDLGYDNDGNPKWCCTCSIVNYKTGLTKQVWSSSKKSAKKAVAYLVLCEHFGAQNKYGPNDWFGIWIYKDGELRPDRH